ncbi:MAG: hypothetical protein R3223_12430, partial [Longimicrobiales bacterium]|nr:hypothetical protein [Longimicrobiales bacterium]
MILARWILFTGLVWMGGCVTVRWLLAGSRGVDRTASEAGPGRAGPVRDDPAATARRKRLEGRLARWGFFAAGLTFAGVLTLGVAQLLEFRDPFAPLRSEAALLFLRTSWGQAWIAAVVGLCSAMAAFGLVRGRGSWVLVTVLVVALAFFPALTGHAVGTEELTVLAVLADGAHVLAAGAWIGSLGVIMLLAIPSRAAHPDGEVLPELLPRFSATALISAGVLALTG